MRSSYVVCTPLSQEGLSLQPNFQKGGALTGPQLLEGVAGTEGVTLLGGGGVEITHKK